MKQNGANRCQTNPANLMNTLPCASGLICQPYWGKPWHNLMLQHLGWQALGGDRPLQPCSWQAPFSVWYQIRRKRQLQRLMCCISLSWEKQINQERPEVAGVASTFHLEKATNSFRQAPFKIKRSSCC